MVSNGHLARSLCVVVVVYDLIHFTCVCVIVYWLNFTLRLVAFLRCVFFTCLIACSHACTIAQRTLHRIGPCANLTKVPHSSFPVLVFTMFLLSAQTKHARKGFAQNPQSMANVSHVPSKRAAALLAVPPSTTIARPAPQWLDAVV